MSSLDAPRRATLAEQVTVLAAAIEHGDPVAIRLASRAVGQPDEWLAPDVLRNLLDAIERTAKRQAFAQAYGAPELRAHVEVELLKKLSTELEVLRVEVAAHGGALDAHTERLDALEGAAAAEPPPEAAWPLCSAIGCRQSVAEQVDGDSLCAEHARCVREAREGRARDNDPCTCGHPRGAHEDGAAFCCRRDCPCTLFVEGP